MKMLQRGNAREEEANQDPLVYFVFLILLISMAPATLIYHFSLEAIENQALETNRA